MGDCCSDRVTYNLSEVASLEQSMTQKMPKSWIEDMMFLKENNRCVPTGYVPKKNATKAIQLHYGSKNGEGDEWRVSRQKPVVCVGDLLRKLGDANFDSISYKLIDIVKQDVESSCKEFLETVYSIVSTDESSHDVLIRLIMCMSKELDSFDYDVCSLTSGTSMSPMYGIWIHKCFQKHVIHKDQYQLRCEEMLKTFNTVSKEDKNNWTDCFDYALKHKVNDSWWRPNLKDVLADAETPLRLCFKIEDYF